MSFASTQPAVLSAAATNLAAGRTATDAQNSATAAPVTVVIDGPITLKATISAQAEAVHRLSVSTLGASTTASAAHEAAMTITAT